MGKSGAAKRTFMVGVLLTAVALVLMHFVAVGAVSLIPGLGLCVAAAALMSGSAAPPTHADPVSARTARRQSTVAVGVLAGLALMPLGVVGGLMALGADPLAIFLVGFALLVLSGVLVLVFVVVFFMNRWSSTRSGSPTSEEMA